MKYCIACDDKREAKYKLKCNGVEIYLCQNHYKQYQQQERILKQLKEDTYGDEYSDQERIDTKIS
jgi:hypothetical protein